MATKIRLQRHGKKGYPFYHVVVADSRSKRDGRFIEKLGTYNPNTNPATIDINFDQTLHWVSVGAEMSDTARAILSYKGVLYKNHLMRGLNKGALTEAAVEKKFEAWMKEKDAKIAAKSDGLLTSSQKAEKERLAAEKAKSDARAADIAAKNTPEVEEPAAEAETTEATSEAETKEEAPKAETKEEEAKEETPKAEAKEAEEAPKGEVKPEEEAPEAKTAEEAPKGEVKAEETPKAGDEKEKEDKEKSAE
ncbi:MAG: 30S ribosomal protein S16 [Fluviicola sp.]|nr:MAG: 30S ribosomal protein S16 [Fluviicola sp.]